MKKNQLKKIKVFLKVLLAVYIMVGTLLYFFQEKLLFHPKTLSQDYKYEFSYPFEELFLKPESNTVINAIYFKVKDPKGVILYFHGNSDNLRRWGKAAENFVTLDYDVLAMDYRTFGKSKGTLSEAAFYKDAQFCYNYLLERCPENSIIVYGRSLGTGIATHVASENDPKLLILETPYYSIADVGSHRFPFFPVKKLLKYKFPTYQYIKDVKCPIFIFHGTYDKIVPYDSAKKLSELQLENLNFITIKGGKHNNLSEFEDYHNVIGNILK